MMISPEQYVDGLEWRYACKKFDPEARLEQPTWHALAESLRLSPSSLGLQLRSEERRVGKECLFLV